MLSELLIIQGIIERGLIFSFCIASMYYTSRIIKFDDLSLEGSFGLGGAVAALLLQSGYYWLTAMICAVGCGAFAGLATGLLHTRLQFNNLMSGIVVMTALFSINLKIAGSHMVLSNTHTLFNIIQNGYVDYKFMILIPLAFVMIVGLRWFLKTEIGFLLQAVGQNPQMLTNLGKSFNLYIVVALMLANALTALSGALFVQYTGYFSIWASVGMLVMSLAGLIIAETIDVRFGSNIIIGALIYQAVIALTFECNIDPEWNKLITALFIIGIIGLKNMPFLSSKKGE